MKASPKKGRSSRAQKVVAKSRRTNSEEGNLQSLPSTRLDRGLTNGRVTFTAVFASKGGRKPDRLDLSFLLDFPGLAEPFGLSILKWGKQVRHLSRIALASSLRANWFAYLTEAGLAELALSQIDEQVMAGFKAWLNKHKKADGKPLHPNSIRRALSVLRNVLSNSPAGGQLLDMVPPGPRGAGRKTEPTEVLGFAELLSVMDAVETEVLALRDRWQEGRRLLELGENFLEQEKKLCRHPQEKVEALAEPNIALALAMLNARYPGVIPDRVVIKADDPLLEATIGCAIGGTRTHGYFYASARDLVPLTLSIAVATVFNADTVLTLNWKNIDRNVDRLSHQTPAVLFDVSVDDEAEEHAGGAEVVAKPLVKLTGEKPRARRQLVRLLDPESGGPNQVSLNLVLDLLTVMTSRIRPHVVNPEEYSDRLLLFVQEKMQKNPKGFGTSSQGTSADAAWRNGLRRFIADNQLPNFTLKTLRATLLDYTQLFNRGDLEAARQVGDHSDRVITWTHYTSNLIKRLLQESTGETLLVRERWLQSDGKMDPRAFREWTDKGCATPGWICLDPFDSPRPNQKSGALCTAYGECPDCPLSAARPNSPRNVMLYEALRRAIYRSVIRVTTAVWRDRWAPVVAALDELLATVSASVLVEARKFSAELPDIG